MRRINPNYPNSVTTQLIEEGYLDPDGITPTEPFLPDNDGLDPITEDLIDRYRR